MSGRPPSLNAFTGYGIELEYMIVGSSDLSPLPIADRLLRAGSDDDSGAVERGLLGWSNELVLHLVEIKNPRPVPALAALVPAIQSEVRFIDDMLQAWGARLMPTGMHPWMDPARETHLWPHAHAELYQAYARIFNCNTHGWANLQSMHVNLPFADDAQFARLHAAVRLVLPILPALAASSPFADGAATGCADFRMEVYRNNAPAFSSIAGRIVPENISSREQYQEEILAPMYRDIAPYDTQGLLQYEWLNSRGAIARFDRDAIEIRVIDTQECPQADLAIAAAAIAVVKRLYEAPTLQAQQAIDTDALAAILLECIRHAERAEIVHPQYLELLGFPEARCSAQALWRHLIAAMPQGFWQEPLQLIMEQGSLATRIARAVGTDVSRARLRQVYARLCDCLHEGRMFSAA